MLVTAIEARPLRSLDRVRVELDARHRQRRRPQRRRQDQPRRGALLRPHRPLLSHLRPPRPDPLRRVPGPRRGNGPRRGRARAAPARLGQPQRRPPPPARRQPRRSRHPGPQPAPGRGLRPRPPQPGQGPTLRAARPPRRLRRRPLAGADGAAQTLRAGPGPAQRAARASRRATPPRPSSTSGTRAWQKQQHRWSRRATRRWPSWQRPSPRHRGARPRSAAASATRPGPRGRPRRSGPGSSSGAIRTSGLGAAPGARTSTS